MVADCLLRARESLLLLKNFESLKDFQNFPLRVGVLRAPPVTITSSRIGVSQTPWNEMGVLMRNEDSLREREEECLEPCKRRFDYAMSCYRPCQGQWCDLDMMIVGPRSNMT